MFSQLKSLHRYSRQSSLHSWNTISSKMHSLARSFMYVPCDQMKKIEKVANMKSSMAPDIAVLDLEDGVGYKEKTQARNNLIQVLHPHHPAFATSWRGAVAVRVNPIDSEVVTEDWNALREILQHCSMANVGKVHLINVPKVETVDQVKWITEQMRSLKDSSLGLSLMIESALAIVNVNAICQWMQENLSKLPFRPHSLVFGSDDYCASMGIKRTESSAEVLYARQKLVNAAKAFKLHAIDMVHIDFKDLESLKQKCEFGASLGFSGKQVIHPLQLPTVHTAFAPSTKQIEWARGLLKAYEASNRTGVFVYENQMIDRPTVLQAQVIHDMAIAMEDKMKEN